MYLGVRVILGAAIMLVPDSFDLTMAIGGGLALIGGGMYAFCTWKELRRKKETKNELEEHT